MNLNNPVKETIKIYAKHLKTPTFSHYDEIVRQLAPEEGYEHFLCKLLKQEIDGRQDNLQKRKIKAAKFPFSKTFDEFDLNKLEHVSEGYVRELSTCDFVKNRQNIVMIGNSGSGKTHLSIALGLRACHAGMNVRFYTAANLVNDLSEALEFKRLSKLEKSLAKVELLILDELSYLTFNRHQSELLFQVISERSERSSVIVTTNLEFSNWTQIFENEIMVAAMIDRLTFKSHILNMNVKDSYRLQQTIFGGRKDGIA
ncbi:MAG: IS21-like element helper ATPase IstB [Candidatus Bathyarchaeota archaeon]|nr:IS21-like element helper ATPase IstB [Candidatus Bathyarchaeum sp.]